MKKEKPSISIVIPTYNDSLTIRKLVANCLKILEKITSDYEIVISDDCSRDKTFKVLKDLKNKNNKIRIYRNSKNLGHGQNFKKLYFLAKKDLIFLLPGNGQINPNQITKLLPYITEYDMVLGSRQKGHMPIRRKLQTNVYNLLINLLYKLNFKDVDSIKLMKRKSLRKIRLISKSAFTEAELCYKFLKNNEKIVEVPITNVIGPSRGGGNLGIVLPTIWEMFIMRLKI